MSIITQKSLNIKKIIPSIENTDIFPYLLEISILSYDGNKFVFVKKQYGIKSIYNHSTM